MQQSNYFRQKSHSNSPNSESTPVRGVGPESGVVCGVCARCEGGVSGVGRGFKWGEGRELDCV